MPVHDQRFKQMLHEFLLEFLRLMLLDLAAFLDTSAIEWLEQELLTDPPFGDTLLVDLLVAVSIRPGAPEMPEGGRVRFHIEVESADRAAPFRERGYEYFHYLTRDGRRDVLPLALFLNVSLEGRGRDRFEVALLGRRPLIFEYDYLGLPGLDGETYLAGDNLLGVALSALMWFPRERRVPAAVEALERIITSDETLKRKRMLCECLQAYADLDDLQRQEFYERLRAPQGESVMKAARTWTDEARYEGKLDVLKRLLERKFQSPLPDSADSQLKTMSEAQLNSIVDHLFTAKSLQDLGLNEE